MTAVLLKIVCVCRSSAKDVAVIDSRSNYSDRALICLLDVQLALFLSIKGVKTMEQPGRSEAIGNIFVSGQISSDEEMDGDDEEVPITTASHQSGHGNNAGHYSNPGYDRLVAKAKVAPTEEERNAIYAQAEKI
ncbi:hypothetical protein M3P05_04860 [Sansalvadorimonas sp. 2012CJ34-2]|uniref:Uncharacterized protein n=1 Tax=Parendozoicomonas callyspongiae TaxID=2942213 RepID=A0ABT0PD63_9GAMM|nr:hypothetical protein [Sansalvadorimonas sp. 2012CJ34-2]MCL6269275.1 hypothetical protein [Sansalvadorimonas sp. 2012CJ34-2]